LFINLDNKFGKKIVNVHTFFDQDEIDHVPIYCDLYIMAAELGPIRPQGLAELRRGRTNNGTPLVRATTARRFLSLKKHLRFYSDD